VREHGAFGGIAISVLVLQCAATARASKAQAGFRGSLVLHSCVAPATGKAAQCGTISVPEDRGKPGGRRLRLDVLVLPATATRAKREPIVFLQGGPGYSATRADDYVAFALGPEQSTHDLVMVDMRGAGGAGALTCELYGDERDIAPYLATMFPLDKVRECASRLKARADLTQYTTENAARDLDDVRAALGVPKWSLYGASYGTRFALVYMRMFPERVERAALLGLLPPEAPTGRDFARGGQQALDSAFAACSRDEVCRRVAPDPRRDVITLLDRLRRAPATVVVENHNGAGSEVASLTARAAAEGLFIAAYDPRQLMWMLPLVHRAVASRDLRPLAGTFAELTRSKRNGLAVGLALSIWCAEDMQRLTAIDTLSSRSLLGVPVVPDIIAACDEWPHAAVAASFGARVSSAIPTLLMSGGRDPATPAYLADSVAKAFSHAERYNDPGAGHAELGDGGRDRMARFFAEGGTRSSTFFHLGKASLTYHAAPSSASPCCSRRISLYSVIAYSVAQRTQRLVRSWLPACRASRIEPTSALRHD
jgi:pimeloyl-ACP methyl ester carboxylesterase